MPCFFLSLLFSIHASIVSRLTPLLRNNLLSPRPLVVMLQTPLARWLVHHLSSPHLNLNSSRYLILISLLSFFLYNWTKYWSLNNRIEISNMCMWICDIPLPAKQFMLIWLCLFVFIVIVFFILDPLTPLALWLLAFVLFVSSVGAGWACIV